MRKIKGDPLTGSLPATRLVVPQTVFGPTRKKPRPLMWPAVPDPEAVVLGQMIPGHVAYVRTRFGIRKLRIRVVHTSVYPSRNYGRAYFVGHDRKGWCRSHWISAVTRVQPVRLALGKGSG